MKERFENRRLNGQINVACKYDDGSVRYWNLTSQKRELFFKIKSAER